MAVADIDSLHLQQLWVEPDINVLARDQKMIARRESQETESFGTLFLQVPHMQRSKEVRNI
jgi:hypothetical protein